MGCGDARIISQRACWEDGPQMEVYTVSGCVTPGRSSDCSRKWANLYIIILFFCINIFLSALISCIRTVVKLNVLRGGEAKLDNTRRVTWRSRKDMHLANIDLYTDFSTMVNIFYLSD